MAEVKAEKHWYLVQTYSGKEKRVQEALETKAKSLDCTEIFRTLVPEHIETSIDKNGKKVEKVVKTFPGYVYIEMIDTEQSWWLVRNTPEVTGFVGSSGKKTRPVPLSDEEMTPILKRCGLVEEPTFDFKVGDTVTISGGNFKDQIGVVSSIDSEKKEVSVTIELFGRQIDVPVSVSDIEIVK